MRWGMGRRSGNIEDRRTIGAGGGMRTAGVGGIGVVVVALIAMFFGVDPSIILQNLPDGGTMTSPGSAPAQSSAAEDQQKDFVSVVLADTEDTWTEQFQAMGRTYEAPHLVLFRDGVQSACGFAETAVGPFYCPGDHKVYLDLAFFDELSRRFGAPGDFAEAYVVAHEVGHHVQTLLGISAKVREAQNGADKATVNALSVRTELQADCFAGVWANHADRERQVLEPGDVEEALNAATQIGDDRLQKQARGYVVPESFTHGTSAQRVRWFRAGLDNGELGACDTFNADRL
jgi:predicted metalloprotease